MFDLTNMTKAKLIDIVVLSQKNRQPDENPGAKLTIEMAVPNHLLSMFDGHLKGFLFTKATGGASNGKDKQATLEGVEQVSDMPSLSGIGSHIGSMRWKEEMTGYELVIDQGLGGKRSNIEVADCVLDGWKFTPKEGGTTLIKCNIESADVSESAFGKLAKLKSREIQLTLTPPDVSQDDIEDTAGPGNRKGGSKKRETAGAAA